MSIEAMKQALKTFEKIHEGCGFVKEDDLHKDAKDLATYVQEDCDFTMRTLRQAIEQAEKWDTSDMSHRAGGLTVDVTDLIQRAKAEEREAIKRPWVGLTDEEIAQTVGSPIDEVYLSDFRRVIEKLKERNT